MADIVLKDRNGSPVEYPGVEKIKVNTVDGETVEFCDPALIPESVETTVGLDFSGGDMEVTPADGQVLSKVNIPVPTNLTPANIAEGVNIAGIVGTLAGGGGGMAVAGGTFTATGTTHTLEHNLGVIPIFIIVYPTSGFTSPVSGSGHFIIGFSAEGVNRLGSVQRHQFCRYYNSYMTGTKTSTTGEDVPIDTVDSGAILENATATSVHISDRLNSGTTYQWYAFGEAA